MKETLYKIQKYFFAFQAKRVYRNLFKQIVLKNSEYGKPVPGEEEWLKKWCKYDKHLKPDGYRIFSRLCGYDVNLLPMEFFSSMIEPILTPTKFSYYYEDKNNFQRILTNIAMPATLLRNIDGLFYDEHYKIISSKEIASKLCALCNNYNKVVVKPSRSESGRGVQMFHNINGTLINKDGERLTFELLNKLYKYNYIIQEAIHQSEDISFFNPTSINTIRVAMYRDMDGNLHYLSSIIRIGGKGAEVDNAHAGGMFCGISEDGKLGNWVCNQYAEKTSLYNGLDFENNPWIIPEFEKIKSFAYDVCSQIIHHDLIALDIALDTDNNPLLVEFNVGGFSAWLFWMAGNSDLNKYSTEIMERIYPQYQKLKYYLISNIHKNDSLRTNVE